VVVPSAKKPWGIQLLRLSLRMYLNIPMIYCSQESSCFGDNKDYSSLGDYKFEIESQEVRDEKRVKNSQAQKIIQGRKIDDIDKDAYITLVDETQGRYGDDLMFDTCILDDEEVFAG
ncbi:hypothetical protein Tco_0248854, partial [Tanacetum coccineum]